MKKIMCIGYMLTIGIFASDNPAGKECAERVCPSPACASLAALSVDSRVSNVFPEVQRWQARRRSYTKEEIKASEQRHKERIKRALSTSN